MTEPQSPNTPDDYKVQLGRGYFKNLTSGADSYLNQSVREYSERLISEATNIERLEHTGTGPPEITAAHLEEARWVLLRRMRRAAKISKWIWVLRLSQLALSVAIGIGASNFRELWGSLLCVLSVLVGSILHLVEREFSREL